MTDANLIADENFWKGVAGVTGVVATLLGVAIALIDRSSKNRVAQHDAEKAALGSQLAGKDVEIAELKADIKAAQRLKEIDDRITELKKLQGLATPPALEEFTQILLQENAPQASPSSKLDRAAIKEDIRKIDELRAESVPAIEPELRSAIATSAFFGKDYEFAAQQFEQVALSNTADWRTHLAHGVSLANQRNGDATNLAAARAYAEAIALAPKDLPPDTRSKLFVYRGAMFKRLGRLREAEADLRIGLELAQGTRAKLDAQYNLSGVLAQIGKEEEALELLKEVCKDPGYRNAVASHRKDYYARLSNNYRFDTLVGSIGYHQ